MRLQAGVELQRWHADPPRKRNVAPPGRSSTWVSSHSRTPQSHNRTLGPIWIRLATLQSLGVSRVTDQYTGTVLPIRGAIFQRRYPVDIKREPVKNRKKWVLIGLAIIAVVVATVALSRLQPAAPTVDSGTIYRDSVVRGEMVREVRGPGTLVPEQIRWISAVTAGRVDREHLPRRRGSAARRATEVS